METTELHLFGVQFLQADGSYQGVRPDGTLDPGGLVDLFDCLSEEAKARFRRGYRLTLYGHVERMNFTPQAGAAGAGFVDLAHGLERPASVEVSGLRGCLRSSA